MGCAEESDRHEQSYDPQPRVPPRQAPILREEFSGSTIFLSYARHEGLGRCIVGLCDTPAGASVHIPSDPAIISRQLV